MKKIMLLLALVASTIGCTGRCNPLKAFGYKVVPQTERWKETNDLVCKGHDKEPCILYVSVKADTEKGAFEKCHKDLKVKSKMAGFEEMQGRGFFSSSSREEGDTDVFEGRCKALVE